MTLRRPLAAFLLACLAYNAAADPAAANPVRPASRAQATAIIANARKILTQDARQRPGAEKPSARS